MAPKVWSNLLLLRQWAPRYVNSVNSSVQLILNYLLMFLCFFQPSKAQLLVPPLARVPYCVYFVIMAYQCQSCSMYFREWHWLQFTGLQNIFVFHFFYTMEWEDKVWLWLSQLFSLLSFLSDIRCVHFVLSNKRIQQNNAAFNDVCKDCTEQLHSAVFPFSSPINTYYTW